MKLVLCLPALNEAATLGAVLDDIPRSLEGIDSIQRIVIDDGSTDATAEVARQHGARVIQHKRNLGTGKTFASAINAALHAGADIIVTMDSDGQFSGSDVAKLVEPIRMNEADIVLCTRFRGNALVGRMPPLKKAGNKLLARVISLIAGIDFSDVSCGFRAISREAALRTDIHSDFEYIHESLLNWSRYGLRFREVPLRVLAERTHGQSRIMSSVFRYAVRSAPVLIRAVRDYSPLKFFGSVSLLVLIPSVLAGMFVSIYWLRTHETAPYTSLITLSVGGVLIALLLAIVALLADLIGRLRFQIEELVYASRRKHLD